MYQALYRKWRPKVFDDVIGQEHITETLKTQVRTGHLSHAYIFIGTRNRQNYLRENPGQGSQLREPGEREPLQQMPVLQRD